MERDPSPLLCDVRQKDGNIREAQNHRRNGSLDGGQSGHGSQGSVPSPCAPYGIDFGVTEDRLEGVESLFVVPSEVPFRQEGLLVDLDVESSTVENIEADFETFRRRRGSGCDHCDSASGLQRAGFQAGSTFHLEPPFGGGSVFELEFLLRPY